MVVQSEAVRIVAEGISRAARQELIAMLKELFSVLANLDVLCPIETPKCHTYLRFEKLNRLLAVLMELEKQEED